MVDPVRPSIRYSVEPSTGNDITIISHGIFMFAVWYRLKIASASTAANTRVPADTHGYFSLSSLNSTSTQTISMTIASATKIRRMIPFLTEALFSYVCSS